jgi:GNAT superfamily N-acetyltransferase
MSGTGSIRIDDGYRPGAIGRIAELHATYYSRHWNFGLFFERKVATELSEFLGRFDTASDGLWLAVDGESIVGSIVIDGVHGDGEGAHLRWFILDPAYHGRKIGRKLIGAAMDFCRRCGFPRVYLWTFAGLDSARRLYEAHGFTLAKEQKARQWGRTLQEQMFEWIRET